MDTGVIAEKHGLASATVHWDHELGMARQRLGVRLSSAALEDERAAKAAEDRTLQDLAEFVRFRERGGGIG